MATYNGSEKYKPAWGDPKEISTWIDRELCIGRTLNFPCGESRIGDTRADVDEERNPDVVADLWNPLDNFGEQSYDTVYSDPPYSMFNYSKGFWPRELFKIARKRLILQTPRCRVTLKHADKDWYVCEPKPGSPQTNVWLFQVFTRNNETLGSHD